MKQIKRYWGLSALLLIWYNLTITFRFSTFTRGGGQRALISLFAMEDIIMVITVFFAPMVAVIFLFNFQSESAIPTQANPLARNKSQVTNTVVGIILLTLPLLIFCALMVGPMSLFYPHLFTNPELYKLMPRSVASIYDTSSPVSIMRGFFFKILISKLFYFSLYILSAKLLGKLVTTLLLGIVTPFILTYWSYAYYLYYHSVTSFNPLFVILIELLSYIYPAMLSVAVRNSNASVSIHMAVYCVLTIAMLITSVFLQDKRKQERVGDVTLLHLLSILGRAIKDVWFLLLIIILLIMLY